MSGLSWPFCTGRTGVTQGSAWQLTHCFLPVALSFILHILQRGTVTLTWGWSSAPILPADPWQRLQEAIWALQELGVCHPLIFCLSFQSFMTATISSWKQFLRQVGHSFGGRYKNPSEISVHPALLDLSRVCTWVMPGLSCAHMNTATSRPVQWSGCV